MHTESRRATAESREPDVPDLDAVTGYEDGDAFVICDTENPRAWVRSDETRPLSV